MAIKAAPAYGGQGLKNTINSPPWIEQPVLPPKKTSGSSGGSGLASVIGGTAPISAPSLGSGAIGTGGSGGGQTTTTTTVTPLQVYQDQILGDPGSVAAQGSFDANVSNLALARRDAIQKAIINAGWNPGQLTGGLASYAGDVTPETIAAAQQNQMSQAAQLNKQLGEANTNMPYDLAASGLDRSGALGIGQGQLQQQYQTASYQGLQDLLGQISGAANTYAGGFNSAQQQLEAARAAVAARLQQAAGYSQTVTTDQTGGGTDADYGTDPNLGGQYGTYVPPDTSQAVAKVIKSLGGNAAKSPRIYQNARNIMAG